MHGYTEATSMNDEQWLGKISALVASDQAAVPFGAANSNQPQVHVLPAEPVQPAAAAHTSAPVVRKVMNNEMPDLGLLNQFMEDQAVGDILVNGIHSIYVDRSGKMVDSGVNFATHEDVWALAETIVKSVGQSISSERPMVDTRLPDGSRVNIVAPPMARNHGSIGADVRRIGQVPQ